jgi:hypothetical protein
MVRAAKGKKLTLPKILNLSTGKESRQQMGFSDRAWSLGVKRLMLLPSQPVVLPRLSMT